MTATAKHIVVDGRRVRVSNPDKVLYPATGFTKGQVIEYYRRIAPAMVPHLRGRAVTLKRFPDGVEGESFFEKHCPSRRPAWVHTVRVEAETERGEVNYCVADDAATLVWMANLAALELHVPLARAEDGERPTSIVFDLDPGPPATIVECARVALELQAVCRTLGLEVFAKVSGSKGIHVFIPLNTPSSFARTKRWAQEMAELLARRAPGLVVTNMRRSLRGGRVLVDWSQNDKHKTTVCVYSMRGEARPTVSLPIEWEEVRRAADAGDGSSLTFTPEQALARVRQRGDLFAPLLTMRQELRDISALVRA